MKYDVYEVLRYTQREAAKQVLRYTARCYELHGGSEASTTRYCEVLRSTTKQYDILRGTTKYYEVLPSPSRFEDLDPRSQISRICTTAKTGQSFTKGYVTIYRFALDRGEPHMRA